MLHRTVALFIVFVCYCFNAVAQEFECRPLPTKKQLPKTTVKHLLQDHLGLMWYAIDGIGLCCDDGYHVVTIQGDEQQPQLLKDISLTALAEDALHHIWIGTNKGCYIFTPQDKSIHLVEVTKDQAVTNLFARSNGEMFVGVNKILYRFKGNEQPIYTYDLENDNGELSLVGIAENNEHSLMLTLAGGGLYKLDDDGNRLPTLDWPYAKDPTCVVADHQNRCWWIGTDGVGIVRFKNDYERLFSASDEEGPHGTMGEVTHLSLDKLRNVMWVTTREDLFAYQFEEDSLYAFDLSSLNPSIRKRSPHTFTDKYGTCWLYGDSIDISLVAITGIACTEPTPLPRISFYKAEDNEYFALKADTLNIPPGFDEVTLYVSTFNFLRASTVKYAYRLSEQSDWIAITPGDNRIQLTMEDNETFTLQIRATNSQGVWGEPATYIITRQQTDGSFSINWAILTIIVCLLALGAYLYYRYAKRTPCSNNCAVRQKKPKNKALTPKAVLQSEISDTSELAEEKPTTISDREFARLVKEAVRKHLGEPEFNVEELSSALRMSRINFYRRFENIMGEKPMAYIRNARLKLAARLLTGTNLTIVEISIRVGFSTPRYFSKCFRIKYGMLPTDYRETASPSNPSEE